MQSRRHEEHGRGFGYSKLHGPHRNEMGSDPYRRPRRRSGSPPISRRNFSPHRVDGFDRGLSMSKRSDALESRDYDWQLGSGRRTRVQSRSPPPTMGQSRKRPHFDEELMNRDYSLHLESRRRYEEPMNIGYDVEDPNLNSKHVYENDHGRSRTNTEKDFINGKCGDAAIEHDNKLRNSKDERRGSYRLSPERGFTSRYGDTVAHEPLPSRNVGLQRFEYERPHHGDVRQSDKLTVIDSYNVGDKPLFHMMDERYPEVSGPFVKDYATSPRSRKFRSTSRSDFMPSSSDRAHLPDSDEPARRYGKVTEPVGFDGYGRSLHADLSEDPETRQRTCYRKFEHSPRKHDEVHLWSKSNVRPYDEPIYNSGELHRNFPPLTQAEYGEDLMKHDFRESSRTDVTHPGLHKSGGNADYSYGVHGKGVVHDSDPFTNQRISDYEMKRASNALEAKEYQMHYDIHGAIPRDRDASYFRPEYVSERDTGLRLRQERFQTSSISKYDSEMRRADIREHGMKKEPFFYDDQPDRSPRKKYRTVEEVGTYDSRIRLTSERFPPEEFHEMYDSGEGLMENDATDVLYASHDVGSDCRIYRKNDREYHKLKNQNFNFNGRFEPQESSNHARMKPVGRYKHGARYAKAYPKSASFKFGKSQQFSRTHAIHKQRKTWKPNDVNVEHSHENDDHLDENRVDPTETEPPEGSEEFKQLVSKTFLEYSKMVNTSLSVQRRYKEQGKAGVLFCIVCGRSISKEFKDTRSLVTHAFMSHKVGLRAKHLGFHKALCVLLGWDTVVPPDAITWAPQVLPKAEALSQKEDLILWPPLVIIHNISFFDKNPENWKVVSIETVETFLRGKGFVRGRINVCLGKPADQSTILVKFLGTFSGVGDAERLHKYFCDGNHGRVDFERAKVNSSHRREIGNHGDRVENILYGYVGIAEDLDKVDFNTRKRVVIKSKKEIEDLENAPIKN